MPLQVRTEEGPMSKAVRVGGQQYCQYSQEKISLITLLLDHVYAVKLHNLLALTVIGTLRTANQSAIKIVGVFQKGLCALIYILL